MSFEVPKPVPRDLFGRPLDEEGKPEEVSMETLYQVRTVGIKGELWYCLKDVCLRLGMKDYKETKARLNPEDCKSLKLPYLSNPNNLETVTVISGKGLSRLVALIKRSRISRGFSIEDVLKFEKDFNVKPEEVQEPLTIVTMANSEGVKVPPLGIKEYFFEGFCIRTVILDGVPWFHLKDVCASLGVMDHKELKKRLDPEDVRLEKFPQLNNPNNLKDTSVVNESGLYTIFFSAQPKRGYTLTDDQVEERRSFIRRFRHWVTSEVIPSIMKTGSYSMGQESSFKTPTSYLEALEQCVELEKKRLQLESEKQLLLAENSELKPDAEFGREIQTATTALYIAQFAKFLCQCGIKTGQKRFFEWLRRKGYLVPDGYDQNQPYQHWVERGIFAIDQSTYYAGDEKRLSYTVKITPKGQAYFVNRLCNGKATEEDLEILEGRSHKK